MLALHEDIIIEIAQYLDVLDLLSFAHTCRLAFETSRLYAFWNPHDLPPSSGLALFLPTFNLGPWRSYTGDDLRFAATKLRGSNKNWQSPFPVAKYHVTILESNFEPVYISGSRWLYRSDIGITGSRTFKVIDGRTGLYTSGEINIHPPDTTLENLAAVISIAPDEILEAVPGMNSDGDWSLLLSSIKLSIDRANGIAVLNWHISQSRVWKNILPFPKLYINSQFVILCSKRGFDQHSKLDIYHIQSGSLWKLQIQGEHVIVLLRDDWCLVVFMRFNSTELQIIAIFLPSLLRSAMSSTRSQVPDTAGVVINFVYFPSSIDISAIGEGRMTNSQFAVVISNPIYPTIYRITTRMPTGSIYGDIALGTSTDGPRNYELKESTDQIGPKFVGKRVDSGQTHYSTIKSDLLALLVGHRRPDGVEDPMAFLWLIDVGKGSGSLKRIFCEGWLEHDEQSSVVHVSASGHLRTAVDWDPRVGMVLIREQPGKSFYRVYWF